jgi:PAS domain S-box-containing protein
MKSNFKEMICNLFARISYGKKDLIISNLNRQLEEENKRFEILSKAINDAIWDWNVTDGSIQWNHALFSIYGYDEKKTPYDFDSWAGNIHPKDKEEVLNHLKTTFAQQTSSWNCIYRYRCFNGNYKYTYDRAYVVYEALEPVRMIGAMQDIDERMIALQEIEKLSLVASKTDNLVIITDADEKIEWVNQGFTTRTGYALNEIMGKTPRILQGSETDKSTLSRMRKSIQNGQSVTEELLNYAKDGTRFWLKVNINPVFDEAHNLIKFVAVETDITLLKEYEKQITSIALDLTNLIATANAPVFGLDRNGYINEWNNRAAELTGFERNEIYGKKLVDELVHQNHRAEIENKLKDVYNGKPLSNLELPLVTKDQKQIVILLNATPRKNSTEEIESVFLVGQDITEFAQYRQSLEERVKERTEELQIALRKEKELVTIKSRFASMVSHEFRTPLSTISVSANHVKKYQSRLQPQDIDTKMEIIQAQVNYMTHLLEDILTIGKNESGKILISKKKVHLGNLIKGIKEDVENQFRNTHTVHAEINLTNPEIFSDADLLRNIFVNLLSNGIKFSPSKYDVFLNVGEGLSSVVFTVRDEGIGIPPEDQERIFSPFDRGTNVSTIAGTGLGLSIVKKAIDLIGGSIQLKSKPGAGSIFTVTIPK